MAKTKEEMRVHWEDVGYDIDVECTCDRCADENTCSYAWDLYNIGDECLAMK